MRLTAPTRCMAGAPLQGSQPPQLSHCCPAPPSRPRRAAAGSAACRRRGPGSTASAGPRCPRPPWQPQERPGTHGAERPSWRRPRLAPRGAPSAPHGGLQVGHGVGALAHARSSLWACAGAPQALWSACASTACMQAEARAPRPPGAGAAGKAAAMRPPPRASMSGAPAASAHAAATMPSPGSATVHDSATTAPCQARIRTLRDGNGSCAL
jgi:hypothetical protein